MKTTPHNIRNLIASISSSSTLKAKRSFMDLLADRIRLAASETTISGFISRLITTLNATLDDVHKRHLTDVLKECGDPQAERAVLAWLRQNANLAAMLAFTKREDCQDALDAIRIEPVGAAWIKSRLPPASAILESSLLAGDVRDRRRDRRASVDA